MSSDYLDFDVAIVKEPTGYVARVLESPVGTAAAPFVLPFEASELAQFMIAVGPPRVASRRLMPVAARLPDVTDYGTRLGSALLSGAVGDAFRASLAAIGDDNLRLRLRLDEAPDLEPVPWEYLYDTRLARFITLSSETPIVRVVDAVERPPAVAVEPPLRILVMISSPSDLPPLATDREEKLLRATTEDLARRGRLELTVLRGSQATLSALQLALLDPFHVFHFIGHGGFDSETEQGVLALERPDGTAHRVSGGQLGTLLHDARLLQLAVLNACEGARSSGRNAFSGVAQALIHQGLPAVVAMQTAISDQAALVFTHEFYAYLTKGLPIDAAICETRKAMAVSDQAAEWGTAVLLRGGTAQPFTFPAESAGPDAQPQPEERWSALYTGAQDALATAVPDAALPLLEQLAVEHPDYADVTQLLERIRPHPADVAVDPIPVPAAEPPRAPQPEPWPDPPSESPSESPTQPSTQPRVGAADEGGQHRSRTPLVLAGAGLVIAAVAATVLLTRDPTVRPPPGSQTLPAGAQPRSVEQACGPSAQIPVVVGSLVAGCSITAPVIDGSFDDWASVPSTPISSVVFRAKGDANEAPSATWRTSWDRDALYVQADVVDATPREVNEASPAQFWRGDAVSFEFGPDARALGADAGVRNGRDRHVIIGLSSGRFLAAMNVSRGNDFPAGGLASAIVAAGARTPDGYALEAKVPWDVLGLTAAPARGSVFAANFNISDAATTPTWNLGVMISSNPARTVQRRPALWQPLVLTDPT